MVLGGSVGSIVTVSPPPHLQQHQQQHQQQQANAPQSQQILDLDTQRYIEHQHIHQQSLQQLQPQSNNDLDMNHFNSAELRSLLANDSDMTGTFVEAHLSENLSSNLNIIDPTPATAEATGPTTLSNPFDTSNNLNNPMSNHLSNNPMSNHLSVNRLPHHMPGASGGTGGEISSSRFLPNIVAMDVHESGSSLNNCKVSLSTNCDSLNTPTPSSDSLTNLKSELQMLNEQYTSPLLPSRSLAP